MSATDDVQRLLEDSILFEGVSVPPVESIYQGRNVGPLGGAGSVNRRILELANVRPPSVLRLFCAHQKCESVMDWGFTMNDSFDPHPEPLAVGYSVLEYRCRHTPESKVVFFLSMTSQKESVVRIELLGRDPRPVPFLSSELQEAFGELDRDRYSKALTCRAAGLGIAALVYTRRVIEGEMDRILDLLIDSLPDADLSFRESLVRIKGAYQFSEKAAVADAKLPPSFFPGHQNPFARLHELTSEGVHLLDDAESCEQFDECREIFEMLFEKLLRERETQRLYRDRLTKLKRRTQQ